MLNTSEVRLVMFRCFDGKFKKVDLHNAMLLDALLFSGLEMGQITESGFLTFVYGDTMNGVDCCS